MFRSRLSRHTIGIATARVLVLLFAFSVSVGSSAWFVVGLSSRQTARTSDLPALIATIIAPGLVGWFALIALALPAVIAGLLHYAWGLIAHLVSSRPKPTVLNSVWEGLLSVWVFWTGIIVSIGLLLPVVMVTSSPAVGVFAIFALIPFWGALFTLEVLVRSPLPAAPHRPADATPPPKPTPQRRPAPKSAPSPAPLPIDPLDWELEKLKVKLAAQERQKKIAEANARQAKRQSDDSPFGDPDF